MQIINRRGEYNDVMFGELSNFAQHQIITSPYKHTVKLTSNGTKVADIEDVRIVFTKPKEVQAKFRISEMATAIIKKADDIKLVIEAKAPSMEPTRTIKIEKWFEETEGLVPGIENTTETSITPNKWLYVEGKEI